ncbi:MAG: phytanoyl-CoA dioxygenase family protein [Caulobacteraceae bacterium]
MRVSDAHLEELRTNGFTVVENFLDPDILAAAQAALWDVFPTPETYHAHPEEYGEFGKSQFAGIRHFPYPAWALNRLTVNPDMIDLAERFCGSTDLELYKVELWSKYSGAIDYDQKLHRDYGNHTLVVPKKDTSFRQMTTFLLLSDVTEADGPTKVVPRQLTDDGELSPQGQDFEHFRDQEISVTGKAGTLFVYTTDVVHRGSAFTAPGRSRFTLLCDYQPRGWPWTGKVAWPNQANHPKWASTLAQMTPRQRQLFGFPAPGDDYWDAQTLRDVARRYPRMDMTPYGG